jgi:glycosyltransferase involved in cell wall biosynthesis
MGATVIVGDPRVAIATDKARPGLSICIPVFNEQHAIGETLKRCLALTPRLHAAGIGDVEIIAVDDGSKDESASAIAAHAGVRLIRHPVNRGYGAALKTGFAAASHELIGFLDGDATYPPEQFPDLCREIIEDRADLVIGSRLAGAQSEMPAIRRLGNMFFARLLSLVGRVVVTDSASGMRVFRRSTLDLLSPLPDGLNLTPVMSTRAVHEGIRVVERPIPYCERVGESKLSVAADGFRFLRTIVWTSLTYNPVRILGLIGLTGVGLAAAVAVGLAIARLGGSTVLGPVGVLAVFVALVCGVSGVSIFALGAAFNYLVSLFYRRPIRQGLFREPLMRTPIEQHFLPLGALAIVTGVTMSAVSFVLSLQGWPIERLWLYLSASALFILVGLQFAMWWLIMSVLAELSARARSTEA